MVVSFNETPDPRTLQGLFLREGSEDPEDDRHASVELHAHERLRDGLADVLEVHSCALDEHPDRDHRVEGLVLCGRGDRGGCSATASDGRGRAWRTDVQPTQQIRGCCTSLDKGPSDHPTEMVNKSGAVWRRKGCVPLAGRGELETAWDRLDINVMILDTRFLDLADGACDKRINDGFVPSCMHNCNP